MMTAVILHQDKTNTDVSGSASSASISCSWVVSSATRSSRVQLPMRSQTNFGGLPWNRLRR
jgi:hypothetical protein